LLAFDFLLSSRPSCFFTSFSLACCLHVACIFLSHCLVFTHLLVLRSFVFYFIVSLPSHLHFFLSYHLGPCVSFGVNLHWQFSWVIYTFITLRLLPHCCYYLTTTCYNFFNDIFIFSFVHVFRRVFFYFYLFIVLYVCSMFVITRTSTMVLVLHVQFLILKKLFIIIFRFFLFLFL
jgi:hypothetical protein